MLLSQSSRELDDGLHSFHLSLNVWIKVLLSDRWEVEEMD